MKFFVLLGILLGVLLVSSGCQHNEDENLVQEVQLPFDKQQWQMKKDDKYPYRERMYQTVLHDETLRKLNKDQVLDYLGKPSYYRDDKNYLYYRISETNLGPWTLHTKTLVIKINKNNAIKWIKIHQ